MTSAADPKGWPANADPPVPEIAFVGRSNVGKSSLLNVLVERRGLARTSNDPGRTRLVNFFRVEILDGERRRELRFVDLPGFGYAKVSKSERSTWRPQIERYLGGRGALAAVVLLVDTRRVPDDKAGGDELRDETELATWIAGRVPVVPVLTKADKVAKHERTLAAERFRKRIGSPPVLFSATTGEGRDALWKRLLAALPPTGAGLTSPAPAE